MVNSRLFVGNLPPDVTEKDLEKEFSSYGTVQNVDLKSKENLVDPSKKAYFAFITIEIDKSSINQCIKEFQQEQYRGQFLNVSVARESFLDRLKREREEAGHKTSAQSPQLSKNSIIEESPVKKAVAKIIAKNESSSSESESSSEDETPIAEKSKQITLDEDDDTLFIAKKKASSSLQNGRITIEKMTSDPLHIITKNQKDLKRLDGKAKQSDEKRMQSLHKMKDQYNQQKMAIQKALAAVETKQYKKIIFDDGDGTTGNSSKKKLELFEENHEEDDEDIANYGNDFEIKEQFQGKKGEKLMKLQSKFKSDSRFAMDSRFLEDDAYNNNKDNHEEEPEIPLDDERKWQLGILERIIGRPITAKKKKPKESNDLMIRYDPTCEDHLKYENVKKTKASDENGGEQMPTKKNKGTKKKQNNKLREEKDAPVVSQDTFYKVSEDLGKSIKRPTEGFSLLSLFGRAEDVEDDDGLMDDNNKEKLIPSNKMDNQLLDNPFKYDSSDSEEENYVGKQNGKEAPGGRFTKTGVWIENFFLFDDDPRFKEGLAFFRSPYSKNVDDDDTAGLDNYDKTKQKLKLLVTRKIAKEKKNYYRNTSKKNNKFKKKHK